MELKPRRRSLFSRIEPRDWNRLPPLPIASKIVFLNKENLAELEGYKAQVDVLCGLGRDEIHIILTGFSRQAALRLLDSLKPLAKEEIKGK